MKIDLDQAKHSRATAMMRASEIYIPTFFLLDHHNVSTPNGQNSFAGKR